MVRLKADTTTMVRLKPDATHESRFAVREEVGLDVVVDLGLVL